jgi:hypothetical protein
MPSNYLGYLLVKTEKIWRLNEQKLLRVGATACPKSWGAADFVLDLAPAPVGAFGPSAGGLVGPPTGGGRSQRLRRLTCVHPFHASAGDRQAIAPAAAHRIVLPAPCALRPLPPRVWSSHSGGRSQRPDKGEPPGMFKRVCPKQHVAHVKLICPQTVDISLWTCVSVDINQRTPWSFSNDDHNHHS